MNHLEGKRVWLTRSDEGNRAWQASVQATGASPISLPCLRFEVLSESADSAQEMVSGADWVVFSSPRGVRAFSVLNLVLEANQRVACVGEATAAACANLNMRVDQVAKDACASGMADELRAIEGWQSAALVCAADPRPELAELLGAAGKEVRDCPVYATRPAFDEIESVSIQGGEAVFLASPSAFKVLLDKCELSPDAQLISIGPSTSEAIRAAGLTVAAESQTRTVQGMLAALAQTNQTTQ